MKKQNKNYLNNIKFNLGEVIILMLITFIVFFATFWILSSKIFKTTSTSMEQSTENDLKDVEEVYNYILNNYYGTVDKETLIQGSISGMLSSLEDKNSSYISEENSNNFNAILNGSYEGLGIQVTNNNDNDIIIVNVFKDTPASKSGLKMYDKIISINDESVLNKSSYEAVNIIKECENPDIVLKIERDSKELTINVKRETVVLNSVSSKTFTENGKKIGYIYLSIFASNTYEQFKTKLEELEKQNIDSLIIDVRDNSGGHLSSAENILSLFFNSGTTIYQIKDKNGITNYYSKGESSRQYPLVVLVNENSASASEILASAFKEQYNAKLVGKKTFGKGTVQELKKTSGGIEYKFTTQYWLTSKGDWINEKGIEVDYDIEMSEEYYKQYTDQSDTQLQKAIELLK